MNYSISHPEMFAVAMSLYGIKEIAGAEHNQQIIDFFHEIGFDWVTADETAWCSAVMNWLAKETGYERSGELDAKSWLDVGVKVKYPNPGDIAIFYRGDPDGWQGHVGFWIRDDGKNIWTLGGNQSNSFIISPYSKKRLLDVKQLRKVGTMLQ